MKIASYVLIAFSIGAIFVNVPTGVILGAIVYIISEFAKNLFQQAIYFNRILTPEERRLKYINHCGEVGSIVENTTDKNGNVLVNFTSQDLHCHHSSRIPFACIILQENGRNKR